MKKLIQFVITLIFTFCYGYSYSQESDAVSSLKKLLNNLSANSDNMCFKIHCNSINSVINSKNPLTGNDSSLLSDMYSTFSNESLSSNASRLSSYTDRKRPFIISWRSPVDNAISLAWVILPENWDPEKTYPVYVRLHGLNTMYSNPIEYMINYFKPGSEVSASFNDGYTLLPWARGNNWYINIGETDVLECIDVLDAIVYTDPCRKYLVGFSMGGFGTWFLGAKYRYKWAGLGIVGGALEYPGFAFNAETAYKLRNIPVYIACGNRDDLLSTNQKGFQLIQNTGNSDIVYRTFSGSHEAPLGEWQLMYEWLKGFVNEEYTSLNYSSYLSYKKTRAYPNPFELNITIYYTISNPQKTQVNIYNYSGQKVWSNLVKSEFSGVNKLTWNGTDNSGKLLPAGVYFCNLWNLEYSTTVKIILINR